MRLRKDIDSLEENLLGEEAAFRPRNLNPWETNPEDMFSKTELRHKVEQELLRLPAKYRVVVMLRDLQQFSAEETAEILKIGIPAMKSRLLRGRLMLREALAPSMGKRTANV